MGLYLVVALYVTMRSTLMIAMVAKHLSFTKTISTFLQSVLMNAHRKIGLITTGCTVLILTTSTWKTMRIK